MPFPAACSTRHPLRLGARARHCTGAERAPTHVGSAPSERRPNTEAIEREIKKRDAALHELHGKLKAAAARINVLNVNRAQETHEAEVQMAELQQKLQQSKAANDALGASLNAAHKERAKAVEMAQAEGTQRLAVAASQLRAITSERDELQSKVRDAEAKLASAEEWILSVKSEAPPAVQAAPLEAAPLEALLPRLPGRHPSRGRSPTPKPLHRPLSLASRGTLRRRLHAAGLRHERFFELDRELPPSNGFMLRTRARPSGPDHVGKLAQQFEMMKHVVNDFTHEFWREAAFREPYSKSTARTRSRHFESATAFQCDCAHGPEISSARRQCL